MKKKIFISYRRTEPDQSLAAFLDRFLREKGHDVFIDTRIPPGKAWSDVIDEHLGTADAFIALISEEAAKSNMVSEEVRRAQNAKRTILWARLDYRGELPYALGAILNPIQSLHWRSGEDDRLARALHDAIASAKSAPVSERHLADDDLKPYEKWALETHGELELLGVGGGELRLSFEKVYVPLRIAHRARELEEDRASSQETIELVEIFDAGPRQNVAIFGDPGAGKTSALKKLLHQCLDGGPESLRLVPGTVPVFVRLRHLTADDLERDFKYFLQKQLDELAPELPDALGLKLWERGRLLLLLDGLDEVADDTLRAEVCDFLEHALEDAPPDVRAVVSCRFAGYGGEVALDDTFVPLEIRPLGDAQIADFVTLWFREAKKFLAKDGQSAASVKKEADKESKKLIDSLKSPEHGTQQIKVLTGSPLLLTLLCLVVLQGGEIPRRRADFYRQCLEVLLSKWRKPLVDADAAVSMLRQLAYTLHERRKTDDLSKMEILTVVRRRGKELKLKPTPGEILTWLRQQAGVLQEFRANRFGFSHLGLQEYLAALHVATSRGETLDALASRAGEDWWREVTLLALAIPAPSVFAPLMERLLESDALVDHADLLRAGMDEAPETTLDPFVAALERETAPERQAAILRLLHGRADERILELAERLKDSPDRDVNALARQLLDEHAARSRGDAVRPYVLLAYHPYDENGARELAAECARRGVRLWLEDGELPTPDSWMDAIDAIPQEVKGIAAIVGESGTPPWEQRDVDEVLSYLSADVLLVPFRLSGSSALPLLPDYFGERSWIELEGDVTRIETPFLPAPEEVVVYARTGHITIDRLTGIQFLRISAGRFRMGSEDFGPSHWVNITEFQLAKTPVTNAQYGVFLKDQRYNEPPYWRDRKFASPDQPVVGVSWEDATAFCGWLAKKSNRAVTLPTEAQWEYAARGTDGRTYPWGREDPDATRACFATDRPAPAGSFPSGRGPFGTLDQAGNVWEWCRDVWNEDAYEKRGDDVTDPEVTDGNPEIRCLRGGSWRHSAVYFRSADRHRYDAGLRNADFGFRVALAPRAS